MYMEKELAHLPHHSQNLEHSLLQAKFCFEKGKNRVKYSNNSYFFLPILEEIQLIYYVLWAMMMNLSWFLNLTWAFNSLFSYSFALNGYTSCL